MWIRYTRGEQAGEAANVDPGVAAELFRDHRAVPIEPPPEAPRMAVAGQRQTRQTRGPGAKTGPKASTKPAEAEPTKAKAKPKRKPAKKKKQTKKKKE